VPGNEFCRTLGHSSLKPIELKQMGSLHTSPPCLYYAGLLEKNEMKQNGRRVGSVVTHALRPHVILGAALIFTHLAVL